MDTKHRRRECVCLCVYACSSAADSASLLQQCKKTATIVALAHAGKCIGLYLSCSSFFAPSHCLSPSLALSLAFSNTISSASKSAPISPSLIFSPSINLVLSSPLTLSPSKRPSLSLSPGEKIHRLSEPRLRSRLILAINPSSWAKRLQRRERQQKRSIQRGKERERVRERERETTRNPRGLSEANPPAGATDQ